MPKSRVLTGTPIRTAPTPPLSDDYLDFAPPPGAGGEGRFGSAEVPKTTKDAKKNASKPQQPSPTPTPPSTGGRRDRVSAASVENNSKSGSEDLDEDEDFHLVAQAQELMLANHAASASSWPNLTRAGEPQQHHGKSDRRQRHRDLLQNEEQHARRNSRKDKHRSSRHDNDSATTSTTTTQPLDIVQSSYSSLSSKTNKSNNARKSKPQSSPLDVFSAARSPPNVLSVVSPVVLTRAPPLSSSPNDFDASTPVASMRIAPLPKDVRIDYGDGSHYFGQAIRDSSGNFIRHGTGTMFDKEKNKTYVGNWIAGVKHGFGATKYHSRGQMHKGEYRRGLRQGAGMLTFDSGEYYEGDFHLGKIHGLGKFVWADGSCYEGEWIDGEMTQGVKFGNKDYLYEGAFDKSGRLQGYGRTRFPNGDVLRGVFVDGLAQGRCRMWRNADGAKINGHYISGKLVGLHSIYQQRFYVIVGDNSRVGFFSCRASNKPASFLD